jgi:DNA-binding MarR family transcriptional regulator
MSDKETLEKARHIFTIGKMIQNQVLRIHADHASDTEKNAKYGELSMSQFHVIMAIQRHGEVTITKLSKILGVSPPSASVMVDRLAERGILTRERSHKDRRKVVVRISPEAVTHIRNFEGMVLDTFVDLVEKIGPDITHKWCEVLDKVKEVLEEKEQGEVK